MTFPWMGATSPILTLPVRGCGFCWNEGGASPTVDRSRTLSWNGISTEKSLSQPVAKEIPQREAAETIMRRIIRREKCLNESFRSKVSIEPSTFRW